MGGQSANLPPFRFGVQLGIDADWPGLVTRSAWRELAKKAEDNGFASLLLADHFRNTFAPVPALVAAADATSTLELGTLALNNDLRHPLIVANEMATLDILSEGRAMLGIGAGWDDADYIRAGIAKDRPGARIDRLTEAIEVIRQYWSDQPVNVDGRHYQVHDLYGEPKPLRRPHPPILVGGGGKRVLSLAARTADIIGINPPIQGAIGSDTGRRASPEATEEKIGWIRDAAGKRWSRIELNIMVFFAVVTDDRERVARDSWFAAEMGLSVEDALASPHCLIGTHQQIRDELVSRRERYGVGYWVFQGVEAITALAPVVAELAGT